MGKNALCIIVVAVSIMAGGIGRAEPTPAGTLSAEAVQTLTAARYGLQTVDDLLRDGIITANQAEQARSNLLQKASQAAGRGITPAELALLAGTAAEPTAPVKLTALQRFAGLITFTNILWVLAIILGVVCFCILFGHWLKQLIKLFLDVPPQVYEVLLGLAGLGLVVAAIWLRPGVKEYVAFTGCLLFGGSLAIARGIHSEQLKDQESLLSLILAAVAGGSAVLHLSSLNGFLAVAALLSALGFSILVTPLCYCIGFSEKKGALARATSAAFVMLTVFVLLRVLAVNVPRLMVFETGALFLGAFVGYLGLLIASSKWYEDRTNYVLFQVITVAAGIAALAAGSIWQIPELQRIGGTFFILYVIEKFMEIPAKSVIAWAWKGLMLAGVIYGICLLIKTYPEALRPFLLF
jgi:hypothetical protein